MNVYLNLKYSTKKLWENNITKKKTIDEEKIKYYLQHRKTLY